MDHGSLGRNVVRHCFCLTYGGVGVLRECSRVSENSVTVEDRCGERRRQDAGAARSWAGAGCLEHVSRLRRSVMAGLCDPALAGWANLCRALRHWLGAERNGPREATDDVASRVRWQTA